MVPVCEMLKSKRVRLHRIENKCSLSNILDLRGPREDAQSVGCSIPDVRKEVRNEHMCVYVCEHAYTIDTKVVFKALGTRRDYLEEECVEKGREAKTELWDIPRFRVLQRSRKSLHKVSPKEK